MTAHLLEGGISADPEKSLDQVCATAVAAKITPNASVTIRSCSARSRSA